MEKAIEARAYKFACANDKPSSFFADLENGYIAGATEQKEIDDAEHLRLVLKSDLECQGKLARYIIDKACEWLNLFATAFIDGYTGEYNTKLLLESFRKAMEE